MGVFATIITGLATMAHEAEIMMIYATHAKAHRTVPSPDGAKGVAGI